MIVLDLNGPDGNAFYLLSVAEKLCNQLDYDFDVIRNKMTSSDYNNLIKVFYSYFKQYVELQTTDEELLNIIRECENVDNNY